MQNKYLGGGIRDKWIKTAAQEALAAVEAELTGVRDIVNQNRNDWLNFRSVLTDARIMKLDNLDAKISTRAPANTALSNAVWTDARAGYLNNLDAKISTRAPSNTALSTAVWTNARAGYLDKINTNLDTKLTTVNTNVTNALNKAEAARVAAEAAKTAIQTMGEITKEVIGISRNMDVESATILSKSGRGWVECGLDGNSTSSGTVKVVVDGKTVYNGLSRNISGVKGNYIGQLSPVRFHFKNSIVISVVGSGTYNDIFYVRGVIYG